MVQRFSFRNHENVYRAGRREPDFGEPVERSSCCIARKFAQRAIFGLDVEIGTITVTLERIDGHRYGNGSKNDCKMRASSHPADLS